MLASVPGLPHERLHYCSGRRTLRRPRREVDAWWCGTFTCAGTTQVSDDFTDDSCVSEIGANTTHQSYYTRSSVVPACAKYHTTSLPGGVILCTCGYHTWYHTLHMRVPHARHNPGIFWLCWNFRIFPK